MAEKKQPAFETRLKRLEEIVNLLERGDAPLEDAMKLFEEGAKLIRACTSELDKAEQQVVRLKKWENGAPEELPFDMEET